MPKVSTCEVYLSWRSEVQVLQAQKSFDRWLVPKMVIGWPKALCRTQEHMLASTWQISIAKAVWCEGGQILVAKWATQHHPNCWDHKLSGGEQNWNFDQWIGTKRISHGVNGQKCAAHVHRCSSVLFCTIMYTIVHLHGRPLCTRLCNLHV